MPLPTYIKGKLSRIIVEAAAVHQRQDVVDGIGREDAFVRHRAHAGVGQRGRYHAVAFASHLQRADL